jgi:hypothetical protein
MSQLHKIAAPTGTPRGTAIFVHGLGGDAFGTWRARPDEEALWPRWLAQDIPGLAVFSVGYPAAVSNWQGTSMPLQDRAGNVLEGLLVDLEQLHAPIVFVCHSLGGLVVKQLLRKANDMQQGRPEAVELLKRIRGVAFMATPHTGSQLANVLGLFKTVFRVSSATQSLIKNDPALRDLNTWYRDLSLRCSIQHRVFFETIALHGVTTVDPGSADPGLFSAQPIAIDADHIQICKPESREVLIYKSTRDFISKLMQSPPTTSDAEISAPALQKRSPMMAPKPPADFVQRPLEFEALKKQLLDAKGNAVAITAALSGAGGYGKTTLAKVLAHDPDIQDAYFDGILWVELGAKPENLLSIISDLITRLTGAPPDDAWRGQDLRPFLYGGPNTTRLVTTRIDSILPANALRRPVDAMQAQEALNLLAWGLPVDQSAARSLELRNLVARLGEWALLLKIVNGFLYDRVVRSRQPLAQAIAGVNERLDKKGLVAFDARNEADRSSAVARTIGVSLELLDNSARLRFAELGIFPKTRTSRWVS